MNNPFDVERSWPDCFLQHRELTVERQGTYRCGDLPVWTVYCPLGHLGNSTIIEGGDVESGAVRIYAWQNFAEERDNG